jgi:diguanylate cyclase (GGDEF)-like protein
MTDPFPELDEAQPRPKRARTPREPELSKTITQAVHASGATDTRELLVRMDSASAGEVLYLEGRHAGIGRHPDNELCVDDAGLSRRHARFFRIGDRYVLEDRGSSNGSYINGRRVKRHALESGDIIQLGPGVCFRYTIAGPDEERLLRQLYESSVRDALTGANNRQFWLNQLQSEVSFALRHGTALSLLMLDIDHFKTVNDTHGHPAGDAVLKHVSAVATAQLRREDLFARYGGEEFVVVLRDIPIDGAAIVAERLRSTIATTRIIHGGLSLSVTVSIGCASLLCCQVPTVEHLIKRADDRLYRAKRAGRNRFVCED